MLASMLTEVMRRAWIDRFMREVMSRETEFISAIADELGRSRWETLTEELEPLLAACRWHRSRGLATLGLRRVRGRAWWQIGQSHWCVRVPRGRVAIIATWNYPVQLLGIQMVQAITAGNSVTVKPSELAIRSQHLLLDCAQRAAAHAGFPSDWIRSVEATREAGERMLLEQGFDFVIFTGSTEVGRLVAKRCAETLTPSALELSGRDSAIVLDDAHAGLAAKSLWHALQMNAGQTCMAPRRVLVTRGIARAFIVAMAPLAASARPRQLISAEAAEHAFALAADAVERGGRSASGTLEGPTGTDRRTLRPQAIVDCPHDAPLVEGRHFGPVMAVVVVDDEEAALSIHRRCDQRLATSIFTGGTKRWHGMARLASLGCGFVTINDAILPTAHPGASISGVGESGWSSTRGVSGLMELTREVIVSSTHVRRRVPIEPPSEFGQRLMSRVSRWLSGATRGDQS